MKKLIIAFIALVGVIALNTPHQVFALETPHITAANYLGHGQVHLSWTSIPDADYHVYYGPDSNPMQYAVALGRGTNFTIGQLFHHTNYVFSVKAIKNGEVSSQSNHVRVYVGSDGRVSEHHVMMEQPTPAKPAPKAVSYNPHHDTMTTAAAYNDPYISSGKPGVGMVNLRTSSGPMSGQITLHWNEPQVHHVNQYLIFYSDDPSHPQKWATTSHRHARSNTIGHLTPGVRYYFWVQVETHDGVSELSPWVADIAR